MRIKSAAQLFRQAVARRLGSPRTLSRGGRRGLGHAAQAGACRDAPLRMRHAVRSSGLARSSLGIQGSCRRNNNPCSCRAAPAPRLSMRPSSSASVLALLALVAVATLSSHTMAFNPLVVRRAAAAARSTLVMKSRHVSSSASVSTRRGAVSRWLGGLGLVGATLSSTLLRPVVASAAAAAEKEAAAAAVSGMGIDLTPMSLNEALKAADAQKLTKQERHILFDAGTELPGTGKTANGVKYTTKEDGVWVSAVSGVPLFDASAKYNSGTGWPSFFQPIDPAHIIERVDPRDVEGKPRFLWRVEVLDRKSGTHLGHVFDDGPKPTGKRYCMNAASLRFIPRAEYDAWLAKLPKAKAGAGKSEL